MNDNSTNFYEVISQIYKKQGHTVTHCWFWYADNQQDSEIPQALAAMQLSEENIGTWFLDTDTTAHVIDDSGKLLNTSTYFGSDSLMVGDGNLLGITHVGMERFNKMRMNCR